MLLPLLACSATPKPQAHLQAQPTHRASLLGEGSAQGHGNAIGGAHALLLPLMVLLGCGMAASGGEA